MSQTLDLQAQDEVWSNVLKVLSRCTESKDAISDALAFHQKLELFSAEQIFEYYLERESDVQEEFVWCLVSVAYAYFGKHNYGTWIGSRWLLTHLIGNSRFSQYLAGRLPTYQLCELADFAIEVSSHNFGWGLNSNGAEQILNLMSLQHMARHDLYKNYYSGLATEISRRSFSKGYFNIYLNWHGLGKFKCTYDAVYFSLAMILQFSNEEFFELNSAKEAAQFTISICEEPDEEDLPDLTEIKDMVQNGGYLGELSEFTFDKENEYHIVTDEMIEFSLDMLTEIESLLKTQ